MSAVHLHARSGRSAAMAAGFLSLFLAGALAVTWTSARKTEARLTSRIAELSRELAEARTLQAACAAPGEARAPVIAVADTKNPTHLAERLASEPPAGFDVCARMESADQAVLSTLR